MHRRPRSACVPRLALACALAPIAACHIEGRPEGYRTVSFQAERIASAHPKSFVIRDFDDDGFFDYAATNEVTSRVMVGLGLGDGVFGEERPYNVGSRPFGIDSDDMDGDGDLDLVVSKQNDLDILLFRGDGVGGFTGGESLALDACLNKARFLRLADFNGDRVSDVAVASEQAMGHEEGLVALIFSGGQVPFRVCQGLQAGKETADLDVGDLDGDCVPDVAAVSTKDDGLHVFHVDPAGGGVPTGTYRTAAGPTDLVIADLDGDGALDIALTAGAPAGVEIFRNLGDGRFQPAARVRVSGFPRIITARDLDRDGDVDLACADSAGVVSVLLNAGDATFPDRPISIAGGSDPQQIVAEDIDGDEKVDLLTSDTTPGVITLFRNTSH